MRIAGRLSDAQFAKLNRRIPDGKHSAKRSLSIPAKKRLPAGLSEKHVIAQVLDVLQYDNWDVIRVNIGAAKLHDTWVRFGGKRGRPDHIAVRPILWPGLALVLYIEFKKQKGGELSLDQITRQREIKRASGFVVNIGEATNLPADLECVKPEDFRAWYAAFKQRAGEVLGAKL